MHFPISFKAVYAISMGGTGNSLWTPFFHDVTSISFKATAEGNNYSYIGYWIAIGK